MNRLFVISLSRRLTALILTIILSNSIFPLIQAQNRKGQIFYSKDDGLYWAAVQTTYFKSFVATQRNNNWCWAACTQMVLNYQGVSVTQEEIVERVFNDVIDRPGSASDIVKGASGWYVDGHELRAGFDSGLYPQKLVDDLINKYPLVVGLQIPGQNIGHAYVLTGLSFRKNGNNIIPQGVILRDPWPGNPSRKELTWSDFSNRVHTIVHIFPK